MWTFSNKIFPSISLKFSEHGNNTGFVCVNGLFFFSSIFNFNLSLLVSDSQIALLVGFHPSEVLKGPQPHTDGRSPLSSSLISRISIHGHFFPMLLNYLLIIYIHTHTPHPLYLFICRSLSVFLLFIVSL